MSRLNWIIQRNTDGDRNVAATGYRGNWRDCHSCGESSMVSHDHDHKGLTYDEHGNKGFQNKKKARAELDRMRKKFPSDSYRLIKIAE